MKKNRQKVKLYVEYSYSQIISLMLFVAGIILVIMLCCCFPSPSKKIVKVIWICICCIIILISFISSLLSYQVAYLTSEGIRFQIAFREIKLVKWSEIINIEIKELPTYRSTTREFYKKWIIFYTSKNQEAKTGGENRKNSNLPSQIKYTKKNIKLLNEFCNNYHFYNILKFINDIS